MKPMIITVQIHQDDFSDVLIDEKTKFFLEKTFMYIYFSLGKDIYLHLYMLGP